MESSCKTMTYEDLFKDVHEGDSFGEYLEIAKSAVQHKDDALCEQQLGEGKELFDREQFEEAMEKYTASLRFAVVGSSTVGLVYQLRSVCLYLLEMYREALADVDLAIMYKVPEKFIAELVNRRRNCEILMHLTHVQVSIDPKLGYPSHDQYSALANVVDVEYDKVYGRLVVANSDIPQGKNILVEEAVAINHGEDMKRCYTCFSTLRNFIPCEQCVCVIFCDRYCMNRNVTHEYECGTFFWHLRNSGDIALRFEWRPTRLAIQTILKAICIFGGSVEKLMKFVEDTLSEDPDQLPTAIESPTSEYHLFLKLKRFDLTNCSDKVKRAFLYAMELPKICALFDTTEKQRFLMHLIEQHMSIIHANSWENSLRSVIGNLSSLFNHSCEPNAKYFTVRNKIFVETLRPISKGEQIFISYLSTKVLKQPKSVRSVELENKWRFICKCSKCESEE